MAYLASIRGLRSFCIAAKCLSFKNAAAELFISPSAISHQVKHLEEQLGISLFKRQTRALELTPMGLQFYKSILPIMNELDSTVSEFTHTEEKTIITISMPEFFASELFVPRLAEWASSSNRIDLQLETVKPGQSQDRPSDLSIVLSNCEPTTGITHELFALKYLPACNLALYSEWKDKVYQALNQVPLIVHQARPWAWHQWADRALVDDFNPKQLIQLDSMFAIARAAQQGMGLALIPMPIGTTWFTEKQLFQIHPNALMTSDRYFLVQHKERKNQKALKAFIQWVRKTYKFIN